MMDAVIAAGTRLAEALEAENQALASLDLNRAATLASVKIQASDAFAQAFTAASRAGARAEPALRGVTMELHTRLESLGAENRKLLEGAIALQSRVIETIAGAALPKANVPGYGARGQFRAPKQAPALALSARV
ncbi:hypothetical protein EOD42_10285 [Rhodovarius crocodyli]|uniref:Flagellar protein FlgN n=1 Tax=Rhodovarius crocodyli TaxID=1979269 RepID=A0A437MGQ4_9PROT|nr:hypothetical protein [Rhodovarius crocodyli]RVT96785.1 hypothetical protein EOD42_10285 [Rhodovarius crocodyli]